MNYEQAIDYIEQTDTPRQRYGLEKLKQALHLMGDPQEKVPYVHIAGTNGKGSTASMLSSILNHAGLRCGLYTSPHLQRYNERFQIAGEPISDEQLIQSVQRVQQVCEQLGGTPIVFEVLTLMAFELFARLDCQIAVLEVGIGGRLDSTNCIPSPQAAVVTQLGLDHTETLGDTIEQIAWQKGGIAKPGSRLVMAAQQEEAMEVVRQICRQEDCAFCVADPKRMQLLSSTLKGQRVLDEHFGELLIPLAGGHQIKNAANVLCTVEQLVQRGWEIPTEAVRDGLAAAKWSARFELLDESPYFILDGGHNPQCVQAAMDALEQFFPGKKAVILTGMMQDKDTEQMLEQMAEHAACFVCLHPDSPRALSAEQLAQQVKERFGLPAFCCESIAQGVALAREKAGSDGLVCALGSLYLAAEVRAQFERE
ncbi:MAG: folylpolyglutamate synthase/dihydrofolate synthase family protein [Negativibacillus sp.]|nr:folylpolyglutamate synthase/dihydrofolate synthase family protein [Negativibacillus sp.]